MEDNATVEDAVLEEMMVDLKEHPGESKVGTVVHRGDSDVPVPMIISTITGGGKVKVYDTLTGDMSWILYNKDTGGMLRGVLAQKRTDGTRVYSLKRPTRDGVVIEPPRGQYQCILHKDNPNRGHYNEMGLIVCRKDNLTAPFIVEQHMKNRHPSAWKIIEREREDAEKAEERNFQRGLIGLAVDKAVPVAEVPKAEPTVGTPEAPLYVSSKPPKPKKRKQG